MKAYLVDVGILLNKADKEFEFYSCVYDHKYGYYDVNQYYVPTLEQAKKDAIEHINKNIKNDPYAVISIATLPDDYDFEDGMLNGEQYLIENVVFSAKIENESIKENFIMKEGVEKPMKNTNPVGNLHIVKNLIEAMCNYALEFSWTDSETIDMLIECGIEKQDFIDCGYGDFIKEYFEEDEDKNNKDGETAYRWDEAWDKEVEKRLED